MKGSAWLAVQGLDGTEAYTRFGALDVNADGNLVTSSGLTVLGDGGPISLPSETEASIAGDGTVSATDSRGHSNVVGKLKLVTPEAPLTRGSDGLFRGADGDLAADPTAQIQDGALEGSNVSAVETMVEMIAAARQFEAQMKSLSSAESDDKAASQLLAVS
jgi:flagellar basal-body rod protein FlgF